MDSSPDISVVAVADVASSLDELLTRLSEQPEEIAIEVVAVTERGEGELRGPANGSPVVRPVHVESVTPLAAARAAGVRAASAPIVFLGEPHSFPLEGWAEAVLQCHGEGWDCVVPAFVNANPAGAANWAAFILAYGPYTASTGASGVRIPAYNCSWQQSVLTDFEADLEALLHPSAVLASRLRRIRAVYCPAARVAHINEVDLTTWLAERFHLGRLIGAERARRWRPGRRVLHVLATPLVGPLIVLRSLRGVRLRTLPAATVPAMLLAAIAQSVGEAAGYTAGAARSEQRFAEYELTRHRPEP